MIQPNKVEKYSTTPSQPQNEKPYIEMLKKSFSNQEAREVSKNYKETDKLKIIINKRDMSNKSIGEYNFISYPYTEPQFERGDFITYSQYGKKYTFLITALDVLYYFDVKGSATLCNKNIKWYNGEELKNVDISFLDSISSVGIKNEGTKNIPLATSSAIFYTQKNIDTEFIKINKRFFIDDIVYKVVGVVNIIDKLLRVDIEKDTIKASDDIINHIANNGETTTNIETTDLYYTITPIDNQVTENETMTFTILKHENNEIVNGNYIFTVSGVPDNYYEFSFAQNTFSIKCIRHYEKQELKISIIDTMTSENIIKVVRLVEERGF